MAGPRQIIDPPVFSPSPFGLLSAAQPATSSGTHWQNGVTWESNCLNSNTTYEECITVTGSSGPPPAAPTMVADTNYFQRGATPFTVFAKFNCSPVGTNVQELANEALRATASWQVERALWTGLAGAQAVVWPHLAASVAVTGTDFALLQSVPVTGAADDVSASLGFIEQALADCYVGQGVIHIPRLAVATFDSWGLLKVVRGQLQTLAGNIVVVGAGYPGTSPAGAAPAAGTTWIYGTGSVFELHSDVRSFQLRETFNRSENTVEAIAEQTYVLGWDCCHAGAIVNLGVPTT